MSNQFSEKEDAQWEEVQQAIKGGILSSQELKFNRPAINIKEYNEIEKILNEINIAIIKNAINDNSKFFNNVKGSHLDLSNLSLTRFPLKHLFEDEENKTLFLNLNVLKLDFNKLCGPIPPELGQLTKLKYLSLHNNYLSDLIPSELGRLSNLEDMWFSCNQLSGSIPTELGHLINLKYLNFSSNQLSGPIPFQLAQLTNLAKLILMDNQLNGPIPPELGRLTNLKSLYLSYNQLSGSIPPEFGQLINLSYSNFSNNQLSGPVPENLALQFPDLVNSEGQIANQCLQDVNQEKNNKRRLSP